MKTYHGSCHCGKVAYDVEAEFTEGIKCNCSHCKRKGMLLAFVPSTQFTKTAEDGSETTYLFNKMQIHHNFCNACGVQSYGQSGDMVAINLHCIDELDVDSLPIKHVDGKNF